MSSERGEGPTPSDFARATAFGNAITSLRDGVCAPGSLDVAYDKLILEDRLFKSPVATTDEQPPRQCIFIRNFRLEHRIATGGMGSVYLAWCSAAKRHVAIKVLHDFDGHHTGIRLLEEARALARVNHRNIVQIFEVDDRATWTIASEGKESQALAVGRTAMIVMEFVAGQTLESWLVARPPWRVVVAVFLQVARGLAEAHRRGLLHCDVTPRNVLVCGVAAEDARTAVPTAKLVDFGLSRAVEPTGAATAERDGGAPLTGDVKPSKAAQTEDSSPHLLVDLICGTAGYAAPEQLERGQRIDARSDVFGLCAAMWHALAGDLPYDPVVLRPGTTVEARSPLTIRRAAWPRQLPRWLCDLLVCGLDLSPSRRPANMATLIRELERRLSWRQRMIRWVGVPLASATVAVSVAFLASYQPLPAPFGRGDPGVEQVWHADRQQQLTARVERADPGLRDAWPEILHAITEYVAAWVRMRETIRASAASEWTIEMKRFAGECLLESRGEFDQILRAIDASGERSDAKDWDLRIHRWIVGLRPPVACQIPRYAVSRVAHGPAASSEPWREHYARGYQHYLEHDLDAAVRAFDRAMEAANTDPVGRARIHFRLALVDLDRSRIDAALGHLHDALRLTAEDSDAYLRFYALKYLVERSPDPVAAIGHYLDAVGLVARTFEGAPVVQAAVGELHVSAVWAVRRAADAERFERCPIDCDSVSRPRRSCVPLVDRDERAHACAQDLLDLAEEVSPGSQELAQNVARARAELHLGRGELAAAEQVARAAIARNDPDRPRTWYPGLYETIARIQLTQERHGDAEASLRRCLSALKARGEAGAMRLNVLRLLFALSMNRDDLSAARDAGEQAWTILEGHNLRIHIADAVEILGRLGELYITNPAAQDDDRGVVRLLRGLELAAGVDLDETHTQIVAEMHMLLATVWLRKGRLPEAESALGAGLGLAREPKLIDALNALASQLDRQKNSPTGVIQTSP